MPLYDYICTNEECLHEVDIFRSMAERNDPLQCEECEGKMRRNYGGSAPLVQWKALSANGVMKKSALGPAQKADRRLQKYHNGQPIWRPIHKDRMKDINKEKK